MGEWGAGMDASHGNGGKGRCRPQPGSSLAARPVSPALQHKGLPLFTVWRGC